MLATIKFWNAWEIWGLFFFNQNLYVDLFLDFRNEVRIDTFRKQDF